MRGKADDLHVVMKRSELNNFLTVGLESWNKVEHQIKVDLPRMKVYVHDQNVKNQHQLMTALNTPALSIKSARLFTQSVFAMSLTLFCGSATDIFVCRDGGATINVDRNNILTATIVMTQLHMMNNDIEEIGRLKLKTTIGFNDEFVLISCLFYSKK
jgi:hypothetical protein